MKFETQTALLQDLIDLKEQKSAFLEEAEVRSPVSRYADPARFAREHARIFMRQPIIAAHASELPQPGSYKTVELFGRSLLMTRDADGDIHVFFNVCRHRGTRLVHDECGSKRRFSCPYHAWTWNNRGELTGVPHEKQGFPELDRSEYGLKRVAAVEKYGFVWVRLFGRDRLDIDTWLGDLTTDFEWFRANRLQVHDVEVQDRAANWKILAEGGLEAYHFKVAHRSTIGPHFFDNLSSYDCFGPHLRSVLPKNELDRLPEKPKTDWNIRTASNLLYTIFPINQMLLMPDHIAWVNLQPLAADRTVIRIVTLVPKDGEPLANPDTAHWDRNHEITKLTLTEDFDLNESAQQGIASGANEAFIFGRFEGALEAFNRSVDNALQNDD